ncbi:hypothetical protein RQP46_005917 [Phenoliferia psychrophenolica]
MDPLSNLAFTTSGALIELVDKRVLVHLRDGRKLIGILRSYDQYANLVLTLTIERLFHTPSKSYAQIERGVFLIRGENVVLLGEIDLDLEDAPLEALTLLPWPSVASLIAKESKVKEKVDRKKENVLWAQKGFGEEGDEFDRY